MYFKTVFASLAGMLLCLFANLAQAQSSNDPADQFLTIYQLYQKAEKLEASGSLVEALQTYRQVGQAIDQLTSTSPTWNPTVVDFRRKRTVEAIGKLQEKITSGGGTVPAPAPPSGAMTAPPQNSVADTGTVPELPLPGEGALPGSLESTPPPTKTTRGNKARPSRTEAEPETSEDPLEAARHQRERVQNELNQARRDLEEARAKYKDLSDQLEQARKQASDAEKKQETLQLRADNAEEALLKNKREGSQDAGKLRELEAALKKARADLKEADIEREAAEEVRHQIATRQLATMQRTTKFRTERDQAVSESQSAKEVSAKAQDLAAKQVKAAEEKASVAVEAAQKRVEAAEKERDSLGAKLAAVTKERDEARSQVSKMEAAQKQVDRLTSDNAALLAKLDDAEKRIAQYKAESESKDQVIASLRGEIGSVKKQLAETQKQNSEYQAEMTTLQTKLQSTAKDLATAKSENTTAKEDRKRLTEENDLLQGIVLKQMKRQAERSLTAKAIIEEMDRLNVKSRDLRQQVQLLGKTTLVLTPKERKLFKNPHIELEDNEIAAVAPRSAEGNTPPALAPDQLPLPDTAGKSESTPAATAKPEAEKPAPTATEPPKTAVSAPPAAPEKPSDKPAAELALNKPAADSLPLPPATEPSASLPATPTTPATDLPAPEKGSSPSAAQAGKEAAPVALAASRDPSSLPKDVMPYVQEGREQYERGNYRDAEKAYERVLAKAPNNVFALSNLGVVRFRANKLKLAEEAFLKAIQLAPEDAFSHGKLGAVYYSEGKYDEAVNALTRAVSIDPKDAMAHNYLGITASQKGWPEAAQKELETAVALDPNNADAHFNLAVVMATMVPPNKDRAREHYTKAKELGADTDPSLEQMLK